MSNEKQYIGGAKEMNGNFGAFHKISFSAQDVENLKQHLNAKGYVNLVMNKRREPSAYGQTHSLVVDTWEPQTNSQPQQAPSYTPQAVPDRVADPVPEAPNFPPGGGVNPDDDIPFTRLEYI